MKRPPLPFTVTNWRCCSNRSSRRDQTRHLAHLHPRRFGVRRVEYTAGYRADHWCDLGHVLYVLEGELDTELRNGRKFKLLPGMSYQIASRRNLCIRGRGHFIM
jgi:quercetin dioxygenase-like cupin family protein